MVIGALLMFAIVAWTVSFKRKYPNISVEQEAKELYAKAGITPQVQKKQFFMDAKLAELDALNP